MARHFKSNSWAPRLSVSSGAFHHGRTDEALTRTSLVPIPVLVVGFKSSGIAVTGASKPASPQIVVPASPPSAEAVPSGGEPQAKADASPPPAASEGESEEAPAKERRT